MEFLYSAVIKRIFNQCLEGRGYHYIAARLNDDGIESPAGTPWNNSVISRILANPAYRGALVWNKRTLGKINGVARDGTLRPKRERGAYHNPQSDWFIVENVHVPLISPEMFTKVREAVAGRRDLGGEAKQVDRAMLSGRIHCQHCGHNFLQKKVYAMSGDKKQTYRYYLDGGYQRGGRSVCGLTNIPADALEKFVVNKVRDMVLGDHKVVDQAIEAFVRSVLTDQQPADDDAGIDRELERIGKRIQATVAMLADPDLADLDEIKKSLVDLKGKREALETRRRSARQARQSTHTETDLRSWAKQRFQNLAKVADGKSDFETTRRVVHSFVDRIDIDPKSRSGKLILPADAKACLESEFITRVALGDPRGGLKAKGEA